MSTISPCIWFDDQAEDAARFYTSLFAEGAILQIGRYGEGMPGRAGSVMLVEFTLAGQTFQALNGGPQFKPNPSISFFVQVEEEAAARSLYEALVDGGMALMPLDAYPWSPCYAWVQDRFGVSWQILTGRVEAGDPTIVPCLMFTGERHGRAAEAIALYTRTFPNARVLRLEHYGEGEGPTHTLKHGRFVIEGQVFVAMDAHGGHEFTFTEGVSLSVRVGDQAALDRLWDGLTAQGAGGPCGWLKDPFGVSWQIVPQALVALQATGDGPANGRMFQAMMTMGKLDIAALEAAFHERAV